MSPTPTCRHVLANGALCQATALRNRDYCRFHLEQIGRRMRAARSRARHQAPLLRLPLLEDLYSVQVALMQLADAIAHREIDPQYARLLTTVLRLSMQNLKTKQSWENSRRFQSTQTEATPTAWDTFEQDYDLPANLDLSLEPDLAFPPADEPTGAPYIPGVGMYGNDAAVPQVRDLPLGANLGRNDAALRSQLGAILHHIHDAPPPLVTADQVELMEIYEQEGQQAAARFAAHQERNLRRRQRRARQIFYQEVARRHNVRGEAQRLISEQGAAGLDSITQSCRQTVSEQVAQVEAAFTRKPPHREQAAPKPAASEA